MECQSIFKKLDGEELQEELIAAVEKRDCLYNKSHINYSNRAYIHKQWDEIGQEIGVDPDVARKRWTTLRDYFQRSHVQLALSFSLSPGPKGKRKKKWYLYDRLVFLLPHIKVKEQNAWAISRSHSIHREDNNSSEAAIDANGMMSITKSSPHSSERSFTMVPVPNLDGPAREGDDNVSQISSDNGSDAFSPISVSAYSKKRKASSRLHPEQSQSQTTPPVTDDPLLEAIKSAVQTATAKEERKDESDYFVQSLSPYLRTLDPLLRIECQAEMQMLLLRYMRRSEQYQSSNPLPIPTPTNNNDSSNNTPPHDDDDDDVREYPQNLTTEPHNIDHQA